MEENNIRYSVHDPVPDRKEHARLLYEKALLLNIIREIRERADKPLVIFIDNKLLDLTETVGGWDE